MKVGGVFDVTTHQTPLLARLEELANKTRELSVPKVALAKFRKKRGASEAPLSRQRATDVVDKRDGMK